MKRSEQQMRAYYERLLADFDLGVMDSLTDEIEMVALENEFCFDTVPFVEFEVTGRHEIN